MSKEEKDNKEQIQDNSVSATQPVQENTEGVNNEPTKEPVATAKAIFIKNIQDKHPDLTEEEDVYKYANDNYNDKKKELVILRTTADNLIKVMEENPDIEGFVSALCKYPNNPEIAFKQLPKEMLEKVVAEYDNPTDIEEANNEIKTMRANRQAKAEHEQLFNSNLAESNKTIETTAKEINCKPQDVINALQAIFTDLQDGKISSETIKLIMKGAKYDKDTQENYSNGMIDGKNAKIEEKKLKRNNATDNIPLPTSNSKMQEGKKDKTPKILQFTKNANRNKWQEMNI